MKRFLIGRMLGIVREDPEPVDSIIKRVSGHPDIDPARREHEETFDGLSRVSAAATSAAATYAIVAMKLGP